MLSNFGWSNASESVLDVNFCLKRIERRSGQEPALRAGAQVYKKFLTTHQKVRLYEQDTQYCTYLISTAVLVPADRLKLRLARSTVFVVLVFFVLS